MSVLNFPNRNIIPVAMRTTRWPINRLYCWLAQNKTSRLVCLLLHTWQVDNADCWDCNACHCVIDGCHDNGVRAAGRGGGYDARWTKREEVVRRGKETGSKNSRSQIELCDGTQPEVNSTACFQAADMQWATPTNQRSPRSDRTHTALAT